ncbi:hypothetical protein STEG23_021582, partial [Scotinomys teguina]
FGYCVSGFLSFRNPSEKREIDRSPLHPFHMADREFSLYRYPYNITTLSSADPLSPRDVSKQEEN